MSDACGCQMAFKEKREMEVSIMYSVLHQPHSRDMSPREIRQMDRRDCGIPTNCAVRSSFEDSEQICLFVFHSNRVYRDNVSLYLSTSHCGHQASYRPSSSFFLLLKLLIQ